MYRWSHQELLEKPWFDEVLKQREKHSLRPTPFCTCTSKGHVSIHGQFILTVIAPLDCNARCPVCRGYTFLSGRENINIIKATHKQ